MRRVLCAVVISVGLILSLTSSAVYASEPSTGAVNNWFSLTGATRLSVDMTPTRGESGYHYYSLSPFFDNNNYGMYAGIQTNGNLGDGADVGNVYVFSVWNATQAYPENGSVATPFEGEGVGFSLRKQYDWQVGQTYTITLQRGGFDSAANGWRWWSTIKGAGGTVKIGEILAPSGANTLATGSAFHERYAGHTPVCSSSTSNLEAAGVVFSNLAADQRVAFYGSPDSNNIFASAACKPFIHTQSNTSKASTGFGITAAEFSPPPAPAPAPSTPKPTPPPNDKKEEEKPAETPPIISEEIPLQPTPTAPKIEKNNPYWILAIALAGIIISGLGFFLYKTRNQSRKLVIKSWLSAIKAWLRNMANKSNAK